MVLFDNITKFIESIKDLYNIKFNNNFIINKDLKKSINALLLNFDNFVNMYTNYSISDLTNVSNKFQTNLNLLEDKFTTMNNICQDNINTIIKDNIEQVQVLDDKLNKNLNIIELEKDELDKIYIDSLEKYELQRELEISAYEANMSYYKNNYNKSFNIFEEYNNTIFNFINNVKFNRRVPKNIRDKVNDITNIERNFKNKNDNILISQDDIFEIDNKIASLKDKINKLMKDKKELLEIKVKDKYDINVNYNEKVYKLNNFNNETLKNMQTTHNKKILNIDNDFDKKRKEIFNNIAYTSDLHIKTVSSITNSINTLENEKNTLINEYLRNYLFKHYKTLFQYNDYLKLKNKKKKLDDFENHNYVLKLNNLDNKKDNYINFLNKNNELQIKILKNEISEANITKDYDINMLSIKNRYTEKKYFITKENIENIYKNNNKITKLNINQKLLELRHEEFESLLRKIDYDYEKNVINIDYQIYNYNLEISFYEKAKELFNKYYETKEFISDDLEESNTNSKLTILFFNAKKNNILKEIEELRYEYIIKRLCSIRDRNLINIDNKIKLLNAKKQYDEAIYELKKKYYKELYNKELLRINNFRDNLVKTFKNEFNKKRVLYENMFENYVFKRYLSYLKIFSEYYFTVYDESINTHKKILHLYEENNIIYSTIRNKTNTIFKNLYSGILDQYINNEYLKINTNISIFNDKNTIEKYQHENSILKEEIYKYTDQINIINDNYLSSLKNLKNYGLLEKINLYFSIKKSLKNNNSIIKKYINKKSTLIYKNNKKIDNINKNKLFDYKYNYTSEKNNNMLLTQYYHHTNQIYNNLNKASLLETINILDYHQSFIDKIKLKLYSTHQNLANRILVLFTKKRDEYTKEYLKSTNLLKLEHQKNEMKIQQDILDLNEDSKNNFNKFKINYNYQKNKLALDLSSNINFSNIRLNTYINEYNEKMLLKTSKLEEVKDTIKNINRRLTKKFEDILFRLNNNVTNYASNIKDLEARLHLDIQKNKLMYIHKNDLFEKNHNKEIINYSSEFDLKIININEKIKLIEKNKEINQLKYQEKIKEIDKLELKESSNEQHKYNQNIKKIRKINNLLNEANQNTINE